MLMMRQLLKISLLLIYVLSSAGHSYSMHFCGDELKDINWAAESTSCCADEGGEEDCCEDVLSSELHASDHQSKQLLDFQFEKMKIQDMSIASYVPAEMLSRHQVRGWQYVQQQPLPPPIPIYLRNQVFLI
jgi:hypothetical protein